MTKLQNNAPIAIFDSGIGGLTVVRKILETLPNEKVIYLGDTARVPYGAKTTQTIQKYTSEILNFLLLQKPKVIIAACNSVSATSIETAITQAQNIPVFGVIEPGARAGIQATSNLKIGVIGTHATISSQAYDKALKKLNPNVEIFSTACPLFVPLVEEGWLEHEASALIVDEYIQPLVHKGIDTLLLGCTHYPLLKPLIERQIKKHSVKIIDSADVIANELSKFLTHNKLLREAPALTPQNGLELFVTDLPGRFQTHAELFLGKSLQNPILINLDSTQ